MTELEASSEQDKKISRLFLKIAFVFGMLYIFIIPPIQMPDEDSHFKRAYMVANFNWFPEVGESGKYGNYFPNSFLNYTNGSVYMVTNISAKYSYNKMKNDIFTSSQDNGMSFSDYATTQTNPVIYLPQALMMILVRGFLYLINFGDSTSMTPANYMYAGRMGNLLSFIIVAYYAIKHIPFYKHVLFLIFLMPMTITLASSTSYDGVGISTSLLVIAILLNYAFNSQKQKIEKKDILILMILSIVLIEFKQIYYSLFLLFFLIPRDKFASIKNYILSFVYITMTGSITHLLWMIVSHIRTPSSNYAINKIGDQVHFILVHPFEYILTIFRTSHKLGPFYLQSFIGCLGWLDTNLPYVFIAFYVLLLIIVSTIDTQSSVAVRLKHKIVIFSIFLFIYVLLETSLYVIWTSIPEIGGVGNPLIIGVQGRYFIPFALLLLIVLYGNKITKFKLINNFRSLLFDNIPIVSIFSCSLTFIILLLRFWVPST